MTRFISITCLVIALFLVWQAVRPGTFASNNLPHPESALAVPVRALAVVPSIHPLNSVPSIKFAKQRPLYDRLLAIYRVFPDVDFEIILVAFKFGRQYGIEPELLLCIAFVESSFRLDAINGSSVGLMQINYPVWKKKLYLDREKLFYVDYSMEIAAIIFREYLDLSNGDYGKSLHLYNSGFKLRDTGYSKRVLVLFRKMKIK